MLDDLNWLHNEATLEVFKAFRMSDYQYNQFVERVESLTDAASDNKQAKTTATLFYKKPLQAFYNEILTRFDLENSPWEKRLSKTMLPMISLMPGLGMRIIIGVNSDGSFETIGAKGIERFTDFPAGSVFKKLRLLAKDISKMPAKQMFKKFAFQQKKYLIYAVTASVSVNVLALTIAFYALQVYDRVIPTNGISTLIALTIGVVIAITLEMIVKFSRAAIMDQAAKNMDVVYSNNIFERFLNVRSDVLPKSIGSMSSKLQSYVSVRSFISAAVIFVFIDFPFVFMFLAVIVLIGGWQIGQILLLFIVINILIGFIFKKRIETLIKTSTMASHKKMGMLVETVENSQRIKATNARSGLINRWGKLSEDNIDDELRIKHFTDMSTFLAAFAQQLSYVFVIAMGAYIITTSATLTMGGLIAITILSNKVFAPIGQLPNLFVQWGKARVAIEDLDGIYSLDRDNEGVERPITSELLAHDIVFDHVKFGYDENSQLLNLPRLTIKEGEKVAILGAIGVGKSTVLRLLAGLFKPSEGRLLLGGINMHHLSRENISKNITYLSQESKLLSGTLRDNLTLGLVNVSDESVLKAAKLTGLMSLISALPKGLDTLVPEGGDSVSGGQKQLIYLTRMMLSPNKILLLDEPTANMDEGSEKNIIKLFKENFNDKQTIVLVTHRPALLAVVNRIIILTPQGVAADDTKEKILALLNQGRVITDEDLTK